jgi:hypothetical protein
MEGQVFRTPSKAFRLGGLPFVGAAYFQALAVSSKARASRDEGNFFPAISARNSLTTEAELGACPLILVGVLRPVF